MEWNAFIVPACLIIVQLFKQIKKLDTDWLPWISVALGLLMGLGYGVYYHEVDLFLYGAQGAFYGASASGIYDGAKTIIAKVQGGN